MLYAAEDTEQSRSRGVPCYGPHLPCLVFVQEKRDAGGAGLMESGDIALKRSPYGRRGSAGPYTALAAVEPVLVLGHGTRRVWGFQKGRRLAKA